MADISNDRLVELITNEVMKTLNTSNKQINEQTDSRPLALVLGKVEKLPIFAKDYNLVGIEDYTQKGDIQRYNRIYITELSTAELSDIALGKDTAPVQCAVVNALLNGRPVYMMESALMFRQYRTIANRNLISMLEGYVHTLQSFGVEFIKEQKFGKSLEKSEIADNSVDRVITEAIATKLSKKDDGVIYLKKGTVLTPSAKDVFTHSRKTVEFVD
ncbi:MAG TPA: hypothetical protein VFD52_01300 [Clostridia bacterium]|nr:hypothetical protein [Clostridia bacterium]